MILEFEVKRFRTSVTQQEAAVYCNGRHIVNYGDPPKIIKPGEKYYGELIDHWASTTPDTKFIHAALFHRYDDLYHISEGIHKIIDEAMMEEIDTAKRRPE